MVLYRLSAECVTSHRGLANALIHVFTFIHQASFYYVAFRINKY